MNCSKGEAKRLAIPKDLATRPWDDLDFLGWRDPAAPDRAYIVAEIATGTDPQSGTGSGSQSGTGFGTGFAAGSSTGPATASDGAGAATGAVAAIGEPGIRSGTGAGTGSTARLVAGASARLVAGSSARLVAGSRTGTGLVAAGFVGVALRRAAPSAGRPRRGMCSLCLTAHSGDGVSLMTARKAGRGGQQGNSVGAYMCSDLACSLYLRGKKETESGARMAETLTVEEQAARTTANLMAFLAKVTG